jgi:cell filamentation protein, protein adenylyltransferase
MVYVEPYAALRRYSPELAYELRRIDTALARIKAADILPASAEALRFAAEVGTIHYSTLIEGNRLGILEAARAARGELDRTTKAEIELVNYVDALNELDRRLDADGLTFDEELFKAIHYEATKGLGAEEGPFKPHHEGEWRDGEAGVFDPLAGMLVHEGSPQAEVRPRMLALIDWVNGKLDDPVEWPPPVIAGVLHFNIVEVHPFADGNGRTARLLTSALLMRTGYTPYRLFNFDAHYGKDKEAYLAALRSVREQTWNQETWQRYFLDGLATEYERVAGEVDRLSVIGRTADGRKIQLTDSQQKGLSDLKLRAVSEFTRREYEAAAGVSRPTATNDLNALADSGVLTRIGEGPARRYRFPNAAPMNPWTGRGGGRPRTWTDDRIEQELRELVGDSVRFPSVQEFRDAGQTALHRAIDRHGGTAEWARRLGITPPRAQTVETSDQSIQPS